MSSITLPKLQKETIVAGVVAAAAAVYVLYVQQKKASASRANWLRTITCERKNRSPCACAAAQH